MELIKQKEVVAKLRDIEKYLEGREYYTNHSRNTEIAALLCKLREVIDSLKEDVYLRAGECGGPRRS
jgi:hypothetical protein